jgi:carbon monoxide dehydrogenase subunit G
VRFSNEITVDAPPEEVFGAVSDVERVAPCLPGARVEGREGDDWLGAMRVKVGPITANYQGKLRFLELDEQARRAVMRARAEEAGGQGNAEARIVTAIEDADGGGSLIRMDTDLQMRGRVAQFGRGAMEKISERMFAEFARNLERELAGEGPAEPAADAEPGEAAADAGPAEPAADAAPAEAAGAGEPAARQAAAPPAGDAAALDPLSLIAGPGLKRVLPVLGPALIGFGYGYLLGRLRELRR